MSFELSDEQKGFVPWFFSLPENERCARLTGYAGTGKTTVMREIAKAWPANRVMWCCPSHQAKNILNRRLPEGHAALTLASALGLGPKTIDARTIFIPMYRNRIKELCANSGSDDVLVVVDEASMVDQHQLRYLLDTGAAKILFVGDDAQLPPVGYRASPVYDPSCSYPTYKLTKVFRQGEGSSIALVAEDTRLHGLDTTQQHGIESIQMTASNVADFYRRYPDGVALCPTHWLKGFCNDVARTLFNGGVAPTARYIKGDMLFLESPIAPPDGPANGSMVRIASKPELAIFCGFQVWQMDVAGDSGRRYAIYTPYDDTERKRVDRFLQTLEKEYRNTASEKRQGEINRIVELINNRIIKTSHGFAMTIHKSQGSTLDHVLLCVSGTETFRNQGILLNMIYTGITRAAKTLVIGR